MHFVDTHCHFDFPPFTDDPGGSLAQAQSEGVEKIIVPSVNAAGFSAVITLAKQHRALYCALGLHPIAMDSHREDDLKRLRLLLAQRPSSLVAIGEIGLDLFMQNPQFERQCDFLCAQLKLAREYDLPVILHSRRTHDQLIMHLRRHKVPRGGVVHGFAGSLQQAQAFIREGYFIGVGGTISWPRARKTRQTIAQLPLKWLLLETDAPDMPLMGFQGQPNRPERIRNVWQVLCQLRPEPASEIAGIIRENTRRLFLI